MTDGGKGQPRHGAGRDGQRCGWRKHAHVPCPNVQVASAGLFVTAVHDRTGLAQIGSHDPERGVPHGQREANVTDHRGHEIAVITGSWTSVERSILLPKEGRGGGDDAFLPRRTEAFASEACAVRRFTAFGEQHLQGFIEGSSARHETLPLQAMIQGRRHIMRQSTQGQAQVDEHPGQTTAKVKVGVATRDDFLCGIDAVKVVGLLSCLQREGLQEGFTERVPRCTVKDVRTVHRCLPGRHGQRNQALVPFCHEPQHFSASRIGEQRCGEVKRPAGLPSAAVNAWKVALGHALTDSATKRGASNLPVATRYRWRAKRSAPLQQSQWRLPIAS